MGEKSPEVSGETEVLWIFFTIDGGMISIFFQYFPRFCDENQQAKRE